MIVRLFLIVSVVCCCAAAVASPTSHTASTGAFVDSVGTSHRWQVNDSHALLWDDKAYVPVGAVFQSRFLSGVTTSSSWHDDLAQLAQLKRHHVTSILVEPMGPPGSLLRTPPSAVQALIDILDSEGFTYGFSFEGSPAKSWDAALVHPSVYRDPSPPSGATVTFRNIPGLFSADYYLVGARDGSIILHGKADIDDNTATVKLPPDTGGESTVLLLYPDCHMTPSLDSTRLPDLWSGGDDYRDSLLLFFSRIQFGKGLRFFLDPVRVEGSLIATTQGGIIPDDDDFRIRFQSWLLKRYSHSRVQLDRAWAIKNQDLTDFTIAARCRPLWYQAKGLGLLYDATTGKSYEALPGKSAIWQDINAFQVESIKRSMNDIADALKQGVANVPVVYRWTQPSSAFVNDGPGGYDGLWVSPEHHGAKMVPISAGYALAAVEQARKKQWFLGGLDPVVAAGSSGPADGSGDPARGQYKLDRVTLDSIGVKGLFVEPPDGAQWTSGESRWLDWVHSDEVDRYSSVYNFASTKPAVIFYPTNVQLTGASIQSIGDGVWWLPSFDSGTVLDIGSKLEGYQMSSPGGVPQFVVYATGTDPVSAAFRFPPVPNLQAVTATGVPIPLNDHRGYTTITFTQAPVVISGIADIPLPQGATADELAKADRLISDATLINIPTETFTQRLFLLKSKMLTDPTKDERIAYDNVRYMNIELQSVLSPYVWLEGEATTTNSFEGVVASDTASEHSFLWIDTMREAPGGFQSGYKASYSFGISAPGVYTLWAAIAPGAPGTTGVSPISVATDMVPPVEISLPTTGGAPYGNLPIPTPVGSRGGFTWCNLGTARMTPGSHTVTISLTGRAPGTNRYTLGIDAICISRVDFKPDGVRKPDLLLRTNAAMSSLPVASPTRNTPKSPPRSKPDVDFSDVNTPLPTF